MQIEVRVFATYRIPVAEFLGVDTSNEMFIELPDGAKLVDLVRKLGLHNEKAIIALVNGVREKTDYQLSANDRVGLFPPIGGG